MQWTCGHCAVAWQTLMHPGSRFTSVGERVEALETIEILGDGLCDDSIGGDVSLVGDGMEPNV